MMGSIFAGTDESPGKKFKIKGKYLQIIPRHGFNWRDVSILSHKQIFQKNFKDKSKFVPEGIEGRVEFKGKVSDIIYQLQGGLRSSMGYIGARKFKRNKQKSKIHKNNKSRIL